MSRQQKRMKREQEIISGTLNLLNGKSFLDLRMSEVAQAADCSMGAIYSHFSCKEDLLIACASRILEFDIEVIQRIMRVREKAGEQLLIGVMAYLVLNTKRPKNYMIRSLAMSPSVWQRASSIRNQAINAAITSIDHQLQVVAKQAMVEAGIEGVNDKLAKQLHTGIMALSLGHNDMENSVFEQFNSDVQGKDGLELHLSNICRYLVGWGINQPDMLDTLYQLYEQASDLITEDEVIV